LGYDSDTLTEKRGTERRPDAACRDLDEANPARLLVRIHVPISSKA